MPRIKNFYVCEFTGCGNRGSFHIKVVEKHEKTCDWNPKNKTCLTCNDEIPYKPYKTERRSCKDVRATHLMEKAFKLSYNITNYVRRCEYWKEKQ